MILTDLLRIKHLTYTLYVQSVKAYLVEVVMSDEALSRLNELEQLFSKFRFYSVGLVMKDKERESMIAYISPIEIMPLMDGLMDHAEDELEDEGVDSFNREYQVKIKHSNAIKCKWLPWGSNRVTAPDLVKGERVAIYRFADSDIYYWKEMGLESELRRMETVRYLFAANKDRESTDPRGPDNSYLFEVSAHDRLVTFRTTKLNDEPYSYVWQLNTAEGVWVFTDDVGNYLQLDSKETVITFKNANGTSYELNKNDILEYAPGNIHREAVGDYNVTCANYTMMVKGTTTVDSPTINFKGNFTNDGPVTFTRTLNVAGATTINGATAVGSLGSTSGPLSVTSKIVTSEGIESSAPIVGPSRTI